MSTITSSHEEPLFPWLPACSLLWHSTPSNISCRDWLLSEHCLAPQHKVRQPTSSFYLWNMPSSLWDSFGFSEQVHGRKETLNRLCKCNWIRHGRCFSGPWTVKYTAWPTVSVHLVNFPSPMTSLNCHWPVVIVILEKLLEINLSNVHGAMYLVPVLVFGVTD